MRDMERALGDGRMPLLAQLGLNFDSYGEGFVLASWTPTEFACNPFGGIHGGVYGVIFDAAMSFAVYTAVDPGDRPATVDLSYQIVRAGDPGTLLSVRADVVRAARSLAFAEARAENAEGEVVARGSGTWTIRRKRD